MLYMNIKQFYLYFRLLQLYKISKGLCNRRLLIRSNLSFIWWVSWLTLRIVRESYKKTTKYIFDDPLKAFEGYFSLINGANIHYPHPSEHLFQLIEQIIFGINESGPLTTASRILANELKSSAQPPALAPLTSSANLKWRKKIIFRWLLL